VPIHETLELGAQGVRGELGLQVSSDGLATGKHTFALRWFGLADPDKITDRQTPTFLVTNGTTWGC
jgi:hypothetical protein